MSRDDWFRNSDWNGEIEAAFVAKLRRARDKNQYLRIQASYLSRSHPQIALDLLDQYFALGDYFDHAQAHVTRAETYISLERPEEAIASYEAALDYESKWPNALTQAYIDLPYFIATQARASSYPRALDLLEIHKKRLMFPVDRFKWHAARALIAFADHQAIDATQHARAALDAAGVQHSGFRYHKGVGLVGDKYASVCNQLAAIAT